MNGDRNGSPHGAPGQPTPFPSGHESEQGIGWEPPRMPDYGIPSTDVKVAGPPAGARSRDELGDGDGPRPAGRRRGVSLSRPALPKIAVVAAVIAVVAGGGTVAAFALTGGSGGKAATVVPSKPASTSDPVADPANDPAARQAEAAAARKLVLDRASRAARKDSGKHLALAVKGSPLPSATPSAATGSGGGGGGGDPVPAGEAQQIAKGMLASFGFGGSGQFGCLVNLWNRESHWNTHAGNASGAYGIPQALPGSKMASAGANWRDSAQTQIKWGLGYIKNRYGTPCGAWSHSQASGWY